MDNNVNLNKISFLFIISALFLPQRSPCTAKSLPEQAGSQWYPYLEWEIENTSVEGNPLDLEAEVKFTHKDTGKSITTQMFCGGGHFWRFRFTGTKKGLWSFRTSCDDSDLDGWKGNVKIGKNEDPRAHGFITSIGSKWAWQGTNEAFIPQYVMGKHIDAFYDTNSQRVDEAAIEREITEFIEQHGFTGFHIQVRGR